MNTEKLVYFIVDNFLLYLFKSSKPCVIVGSGLVKYLKRKKKNQNLTILDVFTTSPSFSFSVYMLIKFTNMPRLFISNTSSKLYAIYSGYYTTVALAVL